MEIPVLQLETTQKGVSLHHQIFILTKIKRLVISTELQVRFFCNLLSYKSKRFLQFWSLVAMLIYIGLAKVNVMTNFQFYTTCSSYGRCPLQNANLIPWLASNDNALFIFRHPLKYRFVVFVGIDEWATVGFCRIIKQRTKKHKTKYIKNSTSPFRVAKTSQSNFNVSYGLNDSNANI